MKDNLQVNLCTGFGTLVAMAPQLDASDILKTVLLAVIGAVVSFLVTLLMQRLFKKK